MYTSDAAKARFADRIAQTTALLKSLGQLQTFEALGEVSQSGSRVVTCRATFDSAALTYDFYLEVGTNKIQGIVPKRYCGDGRDLRDPAVICSRVVIVCDGAVVFDMPFEKDGEVALHRLEVWIALRGHVR
jgi:hypothetical protein